MGKDFNSRNDRGVSAPPVDGPGSSYSAAVFHGPTFSTSGIQGPNEDQSQASPPAFGCTPPEIDGPNNKEASQAKGNDTNPSY